MGVVGFAHTSLSATRGLLLSAESGAGRQMTLSFAEDEVTAAVQTAVLCAEPAAAITTAKLWMPDMGHGSSPTALVRQDDACTRVERLNFLMPGLWELRVGFADGDAGTFSFSVSQ
jgi:hypothetical protein